MSNYLTQANATILYVVVASILFFVVLMCIVFIIKSYRAGLKLGMDKQVLKKAVVSSATFTAIPSISILLGVIALSGSLGVPVSWLRLSVIGNLPYETIVAKIAAEGVGASLNPEVLTMNDLVTILLVMTVGIIWGCLLTIFFLKPYSKKIARKPKTIATTNKKQGFAAWAMVAMFIGMCATFIGSYMSIFIVYKDYLPIATTIVAAIVMKLNMYLVKEKGFAKLESFSLALSMIIAMAAAVLIGRF